MAFNLLGSWKFVGSRMTDALGNSLPDPLNQATGLIVYSATHMTVQLSIPENLFLDIEIRSQLNYISYYGLYTLDTNTKIITHQVISSNIQDMTGKLLGRKIKEIAANKISLANIIPEKYAIDTLIYRELFWEKVDSILPDQLK